MMEIIIIAIIIFCIVALIAEDFPQVGRYLRNNAGKRKGGDTRRNYYNPKNYTSMNQNDVYCQECGSPNVTVYRDERHADFRSRT